MLRVILILFIAIFVVTIGFSVVRSDDTVVKSYYSDMKHGWWWYEKEPEKPKEEEKEEEKPVERKLPSLSDYTTEELWNMHPDDFQALLMEFMKKAVQYPTVENVTEYYTMQDIARRKALAFTNVASYVMQTNPQLNVGKDYPIVHPGKTAMVGQQSTEIENTIKNAKDSFALLYFYSPDCPYCKAQSGINKFFIQKYNWQIKEIDINEHRNLASQFAVSTTPTMILIYKYSQDYMPISVGVTSMDDIEIKVYRSMRLLRGEITPEEYSLYEFQKGSTFDTKRLPGR